MDMVIEILSDAAEYPAGGFSDSARTMLKEGLPYAVLCEAAPAELHGYQKEFVTCTGEGLDAAKAAASAAVAALSGEVREAEAQLAAAQEACEAAQKGLDGLRGEVAARAEEQRLALAEVDEARAAHAEVKEVEDQVLAEQGELEGKKKVVDALLASMRAFESTEEAKDLDAAGLMAYLAEVGAEKTLLAAAGAALPVPKSSRGAFDALACAEVLAILSGNAAKFEAELAAIAPKVRYATSEALGLWAVHDVATETNTRAKVKLSETRDAEKQASRDLSAAKAEVAGRQRSLGALAEKQAANEGKVRKIVEASAALERLRCPPPPAEGTA